MDQAKLGQIRAIEMQYVIWCNPCIQMAYAPQGTLFDPPPFKGKENKKELPFLPVSFQEKVFISPLKGIVHQCCPNYAFIKHSYWSSGEAEGF